MIKILLSIMLLPAILQAQHQTTTQGITRGAADARYLKLDASNDPITGALAISDDEFSVGGSTLVVSGGKVSVGTATSNVPLKVYKPGAHTPILEFEGEATGNFSMGFDAGHNVEFKAPAATIFQYYGATTKLLELGTLGEVRSYGNLNNPALPSFTRINDSDTGMYFLAANELGFTTGGINRLTINATGQITIPGSSFSVGTSTFVVAGGRVGIGTASPLRTLHIKSADDGNIRIEGTDNTKTIGFDITPQGALSANNLRWLVAKTPSENSFSIGVYNGATQYAMFNIFETGGQKKYSRTKAQILAIDPIAVGEEYYCSDCTASNICISTGTAVGQFSDIQAKTVACQ